MSDTATVPTIEETFAINPYVSNIITSTHEGSKLYLKAMEEFPKKDKVHISISNEPKINEVLEKCRFKYAWDMLLSNVLNNDGVEQDIL